MATIVPQQQTLIANLYTALYNRAPDAAGFGFWVQALSNGASLTSITSSFLTSPESRAIYPTSQTSEQFIATFYTTVFGRAPDAGGLAFWAGVVNANGGSSSDAAKAVAVSQIINVVSTPLTTKPADITDAQFAQTVKDRATFVNKGTVGVDFAVNVKSNDVALAKLVLAGVTDTAASVTAAQAIAATGANPGVALSLTATVDTLVGGAGNDTFTADNTGTTKFMTVADSINGGAGIDTVRYFAATGDTALTLAQLSNVEKLYVNGGDALVVNTGTIVGVTDAEFDVLGGDLAVTATSAQTVKVSGNAGTVYAIGLTVGATDTTANLVLNGSGKLGTASAITVTGAALTTLNVQAAGNSFITLANGGTAALTALNITGDKNITVGSDLAGLKTVNASSATGAVTFDQSTIAANNALTFTGGSGNDKVIFAQGFLTAAAGVADVLDGGAGTDTLQVNDTTLSYAAINAAKNFEVLALGTTGATVDVAQVTAIKGLAVANTGSTTFTNANNASTFSIDNSAGVTAVSIGNTVGQTTTDITLNNAAATAGAQTLGTLTLTGSTVVSLTSSGTSTNSNVITTLANSDNSAITVKGAADLTFTLSGTVVGSSVDASAFTGKLNVTGSARSDVIKGGAGADIISGGVVTFAAGPVAPVAGTAEVQTVTLGGSPTGAVPTTFLGVAVSTPLGTTLDQLAQLFVDDKARILAPGTTAANAGITDITKGAGATLVLTFTVGASGTAGAGDVSSLAASPTDNGITFSTGVENIKGIASVAAQGATSQSLDTLTGGAGADTFVFATPDNGTLHGNVTAIITDFATGTDKIQVSGGGAGAGSATTFVKAAAVAADLATLLTAADNALNGTVQYFVGQVGADSYLVTDANGTGYTNVIKLAGVALTGIVATDLIAAPLI